MYLFRPLASVPQDFREPNYAGALIEMDLGGGQGMEGHKELLVIITGCLPTSVGKCRWEKIS